MSNWQFFNYNVFVNNKFIDRIGFTYNRIVIIQHD